MASYEEIMQAVRNAHDAGDTESAQRLAQMAQGLKTKEKKPESNMLGDLWEGAKGTAAAVGDMATGIGKGLILQPLLTVGGKITDPSLSTQDHFEAAGKALDETYPAFGRDMDKNAAYRAAMVGPEKLSEGLQWLANKGSMGNKDVEGALNIGLNFAPIPFVKPAMRGAGKVIEAVDPGLRAPYVKPPDVTSLREEMIQRKAAENAPVVEAGRQADLFPESITDTTGHASPYTGNMPRGDFGPETLPQRDRRQQDLPLRNDLPEVIKVNEKGVQDGDYVLNNAEKLQDKIRTENGELPPGTPKTQTDIFDPQTNMHRAYTDQRVDNGKGGERPLTRAEFNQTIKALADEPGTRFQTPDDMAAAYAAYKNKLNEPDLFDIGSRNEAARERAYQESIPRLVEEHPMVKKADERIQKASEVIMKAQLAIKEGYPHGPQLIRATKELTSLEKKAAEVRANVTEALRKKESPKSVGLKGQPITSGSKYSRQRGAVLLPFGKKPASDQIKKIKSLESLLPEHVTVAATPADVAAKVLSTTDVTENAYTKGTRLFTKGFQYEKGKTNHPLIKYAYDQVSDAVDASAHKLRKILQEDILKPIRRLKDAEMIDLHAAMHDAMMNKYDLTPEMLAKHGFNEKQIQVFNGFQKAYTDVFNSTNEMLVAGGQKPISRYTGYMAGVATGDFRTAIVKTGDNGVPTFVGFIGSNIKAVRDANVKAFLAKHPEYSIGPEQFVGDGKLSNSQSKALVEALSLLGKEGSDVANFSKAYAEAMQGEAMGYQGANKHLLDKKGVFGNEGAKQWVTGWKAAMPMSDKLKASVIAQQNALDGFRAQVSYIETMTKWSELSKASKNIAEVLSNPAVQAEHPVASRMVKEYLSNALGHNPSRVGEWVSHGAEALGHTIGVGPAVFRQAIGGLKGAQNVTFFALSPAFLAANSIQAAIATPLMVNRLRARGLDVAGIDKIGVSEYTAAMIEGSRHLKNQMMGKKGDAFSERMFAYGEEHGMSATQIFDHNTDIRVSPHFIGSKIAETGMGFVESAPRMTSFLMFSNILRKNGFENHPDIFKIAKELTNDVMADYRPHEQSRVNRMFGPLAPLLANVSTFANNAASLNAAVFREAMKTKDGSALVAMALTGLALHGLLGFPGFHEADLLVEQISKAIGKPTTLTNEVLKITAGKEGGDFVSMGLGTELGLALHNTLGRSSFLPPQVVGGTAGAAIDTGKAAYGAVTSPSEMSAKRLAYNLSPRVLKGMEDLTWFSKGDLALSRKEGYASKGIYERDEFDKTARRFGVTSKEEFKAKEQDRQQIIQDQAYKKLQDSILIKMDNEFALNKGVFKPERVREHFDNYIEVEGDAEQFRAKAKSLGIDINTTAMERYLRAKSKSGNVSAKKALARMMEKDYGDK